MDQSFGTWIKLRRKSLDLTQQELAAQVGCSSSLIFKIESDERRPSRQIAELLAEKLDIPAEQHALFLKIARQEKGIGNLDAISHLSALETASSVKPNPNNLPVPPTPLVGRGHELRVITKQLLEPSCRLLTLTGPGGIGKTRLAIEAGRQLESHFPDGVYFISLAGVGMIEAVIPTMADVLGLTFSGPAEPILQINTFLRTKETLLVIDNMEHLLEGGSLLGEILQHTQRVKLLITSREQLHLQWEWIFEVQGLPVPETADVNLERNSAVMLFVQRASQASRDFTLETEDMEALVRICKLVGGLPLAIELAASWVRMLSCSEIALELEQGLDFLETKKVDLPLRHRSIKAVFNHSWTLLTDQEQLLLMRLSVFKGGFAREAAITAMGASLIILSSLVDKSLLRYRKNTDRYDLHELIRQYAFAQLQSDPIEELQTSEKHALYYANWIAALESPFKSAQQPQTSQQIRAETSNWLAVWYWAVEHQRLDILRQMSPCLNWYFEVHGYYAEALSAFRAALGKFRALGAPASLTSAEEKNGFAYLVDQVGWFEFRIGNVEQGIAHLAESLEIAREYNDIELLYYIFGNWGYIALVNGDNSEAGRLTTESLKYGRILNSPWHIAIPINVLGTVAYQLGNLTESYRQLTESLKIWRSVGDPRGLVLCMLYLAMTTFALEDIPATRSILEEGNQIAEENMDRWAQAFSLDMLGMVSLSQGQKEEALTYLKKSICLSREIGDQLSATQTIVHMGQVYSALQSYEDANRLFLEAYTNAQQARWIPIILQILISQMEMQNKLLPETKLAVTLAVLSHSANTPNLRIRCERLRDGLTSLLTPKQIKSATILAMEKNPEDWAQEVLNHLQPEMLLREMDLDHSPSTYK
jgi:predicted ATPase/transcriptional regulator with XRE-family HTH domain